MRAMREIQVFDEQKTTMEQNKYMTKKQQRWQVALA